MYLTFAGLGRRISQGARRRGADFLTAYKAEYGTTRRGATRLRRRGDAGASWRRSRSPTARARASPRSCFSARITIPADESILGKEIKIDETGDTTVKDMSIFKVTGN